MSVCKDNRPQVATQGDSKAGLIGSSPLFQQLLKHDRYRCRWGIPLRPEELTGRAKTAN
ncbi:MAG: hypothetical protein K8S55_06155 [Phycisphaerae bacterium]|nr:hypothetical protein [Phycisphaerae bacterium]